MIFTKENANGRWLKCAVSILGVYALGLAQAENITNTWNNVAANTPQTAHAWTEIGNWSYSERGVPNGANAGASFNVAHTDDVFIRLPDDLALGWYVVHAGGNNLYLLGDTLSVESSARALLSGSTSVIYADMDVKAADNRLGNGSNLHLAGDLSFSGASGRLYFNLLRHRFDLFAKQAGELRSSSVTTTSAAPQSLGGGYFVYAPRGAAKQTGSWNQTEGSPYLQLAGTAHDLAVGTLVTGDGIPANTFLKRIFGDSWIELSAAATKTKSANELTFAAFTPDFTLTTDPNLNMLPYTARFAVLKRRSVDKAKWSCRFIFGNQNGKCYVTFGLTDDEVADGYLPGDIELLTVSTHANATGSGVQLANCKMLLTGKNGALAFTGLNFACATSTSQAELCVPSTTAASLDSFINVNGTVIKTGLGSLTMNVSSLTNEGAIVVSEGSLTIQNTSGAGEPLVFAALELAANGTLVVPATGISVGRLTAAAGAKVSGGKLTVTGTASGLPMPVDGAEVSVLVRDCSANVVPAEGRWFHLDACDTNRLEFVVENDERHITKWYDVSGSGCYAYAGDSHPWFIEDASNGHPMIDLGDAVYSKGTGNGGTGGAITSRGFSLYKADDTGFSAQPVQSAFYVIDSAKGGGALLSQAGSNFPQYGVPHWPEAGLGVAPILGFTGAGRGGFLNADINDGTSTFRTNGIAIYPRSTPFSGGIDVVSFTNNAAVQEKVTGMSIGKVIGGSATYDKSANGLAFGEVILFTNGVSPAAMLDIEAYLSRKWLGRRTEGYYLAVNSLGGISDANSKISVMGGGAIETEELVTGGAVEGNVELLSGGGIEGVVSSTGTISPLSVAGTLILPENVTVRLSGSFGELKEGDYDLVAATALAGVTDRTVVQVEEPLGTRKKFKARIDGSKIVLAVLPQGLFLILR